MSTMTSPSEKSNSGPAKRKRGRPLGSKNKQIPPAELVLANVCVKGSCKLTIENAKVVKGAPTRYVHYPHPPYNQIKKQKVRCECGQLQWRRTAIYREEKVGLFFES